MPCVTLPAPLDHFVATITSLLDRRHAELFPPLFVGVLFGQGRRTATSWFRAGGITEEFRRGYTLLGTLGRHWCELVAGSLFRRLRRTLPSGPRWVFALDDTPTQRYGPCVEGAGIHHNPTPGPTHQRYVYGHVWVTLAWVVRHPLWHTLALPLLAHLYIRQADLPEIPVDHRPPFVTKLEQAAGQIHWLAEQLRDTTQPIWVVVDGFYGKRPVLKAARHDDVVVVGRLRKDAALRSVPPAVPPEQRGRGRPRVYGTQRFSLAKRAGHAQGWQTVECFQYQQLVAKTVKTFLATWRPAGGVIRVVLVREDHGWVAFFGTDPAASVRDILEAAAGRTAVEETFKDVKEVEGAGQQQLRYGPANLAAFCCCLWGYTAVEWWAWAKPFEQLCDRSASPWDDPTRRPSHADRRKALQRQGLQEAFQRVWGERPCPPEIRAHLDAVLAWATGTGG